MPKKSPKPSRRPTDPIKSGMMVVKLATREISDDRVTRKVVVTSKVTKQRFSPKSKPPA